MARRFRGSAHRSATEWARIIEQQRASGQTQGVFCHQQGISRSTFQHWKKRLRETSTPRLTPWVELVPPSDPVPVPEEPRSARGGWEIELELGDDICLRLARRC